jgi:translocation and assembly module TamB
VTGEVEVQEAPRPRRRWPRWQRALAAVLALLGLLAAIAWLQRVQLVQGFVERELARRGVSARYEIARIGFFRQRIEKVSIGDPAAPDLTADWVEIDTGFTGRGPVVTGVRAGSVRVRGKLEGGKLSLGQIDRLLPAPSGKPVSLPKMRVDVADARMALATPYGAVALRLAGSGRLDDGFVGTLAATAPRLRFGGCNLRDAKAELRIAIEDAAPKLLGPVQARAVACGDVLVWEPVATIDAGLDAALARWRGRADVTVETLELEENGAEGVKAAVTFDGSAARTAGQVDLTAGRVATAQASARAVRLAGRYEAGGVNRFEGRVTSPDVALDRSMREAIAGLGKTGAGTPVGPLAAQFARAAEVAALGGRVEALVSMDLAGSTRVRDASFAAPGGARLALGGEGLTLSGAGVQVGGTLSMRGGGLPEATMQLSQAAPGAPIRGVAQLRPYAAGGARLELATVRFEAGPGGTTRISTRAVLSGPLSGGRVDGLAMPVEARWDGRDLLVNPACVPLAFERLMVSSLALDRSRVTLCPVDGALLAVRDGRLSGGARFGAVRLGGRLGSSPLALSASGGRFGLGRQDFTLGALQARIGSESVTELNTVRLSGRIDAQGLGGDFEGASGRIGSVPLRLDAAAGNWRFADSRLAVDGRVRVSDMAEAPRFNPLVSDDVRLTLAGNRIDAGGTLRLPGGTEVARATITHDLNATRGSALLDVPGIGFDPDGLQPRALTELTYGIIAAVKGRISGQGRIRWEGSQVSSDGDFRTEGIDLAAGFGPVTGLKGEIHFSDLLGMQTAPGQMATIAQVNPGVPVENGTVRYRILDSQRVQVESGRWPFAGGVLELEPTLLDFSQDQARRMTFRLTGVDAGQFLAQMNFANLNATGTFDGVLPMIFDARGGRIEGGRLKARGGGSIAYNGEVTQRDLGVWGNMAFQALRSLNYRSLELEMNGSLAGDMVTEIRFDGVSQGEGARRNFLTRKLEKLPFVFNVTIRAPFRQLLDTIQSYYDPARLIERNLPALQEEQKRREQEQGRKPNIQRSESEAVP